MSHLNLSPSLLHIFLYIFIIFFFYFFLILFFFFFFFFNDTATTEIYTLSLHDALPISGVLLVGHPVFVRVLRRLAQVEDRKAGRRDEMRSRGRPEGGPGAGHGYAFRDRKSTRLNSSHLVISYAVFCLKKKKKYKASRSPCAATSTAERLAPGP